MEFRFKNSFWVIGNQPVRMLRSNNRDVNALLQDCDPEPLVYLCLHSDRWFGQGKSLTNLLYFNCAEALLSSGEEGIAMNMAEGLLPKCPDRSNPPEVLTLAYLILSRGHTQLEHWEEAIEAQNMAMSWFNRLGKREQQNKIRALMLNGYTLQIHLGDIQDMEAKCLNLLNTAPCPKDQVEAHFLLGKLYQALHQEEKAETHLTYAVEKGNKLLAQKEAALLLAQLRGTPLTKDQLLFSAQRAYERKQYQKAITLYQKVFPLEGSDPKKVAMAYMDASSVLLNLGRFEESLVQLERVDPSSVPSERVKIQLTVLYIKAVAYTELGRLEEATEAQNQAVALFEEHKLEGYRHVLCRSGLQLKIKRGELEGLEKETEALLENTPSDFWKMSAHMVKANYLLAADRGQEAKPHLEYVIEHGGEHRFVREAQAALNSL